jgi:hypothetical protein
LDLVSAERDVGLTDDLVVQVGCSAAPFRDPRGEGLGLYALGESIKRLLRLKLDRGLRENDGELEFARAARRSGAPALAAHRDGGFHDAPIAVERPSRPGTAKARSPAVALRLPLERERLLVAILNCTERSRLNKSAVAAACSGHHQTR